MQLEYVPVLEWPKLSWLARCKNMDSTITVFHGNWVETTNKWFAEAVWAGDYDSGDFDLTDIVAGSGARVREGKVVFVSSGSTVDRLQFMQVGDVTWISNSLCCLLAVVDGVLNPRYRFYFRDIATIANGIEDYHKELATSAGLVKFLYFDNMIWDGRTLTVQSKPMGSRNFASFSEYRAFLDASIEQLHNNMVARHRQQQYKMLGSLSTGYDSTTVSVLAKQVGCDEAISFDTDRVGDDDSGEAIADILGIRCHLVRRDAWLSAELPEVPFIAAGSGQDIVFKGAEEFLQGSVLISGFHGDKVWAKDAKNLSANIVRGDNTGLGLTEYRLWVGFLHCPIPFWGVRQIRSINAISCSPEMAPWDIGNSYSRPICRQIVEEASVPRHSFGIKKKGMAVPLGRTKCFLTAQSTADYYRWLKGQRWEWIKAARIPPLPWLEAGIDLGRPLRETLRTWVPRSHLRRGSTVQTGGLRGREYELYGFHTRLYDYTFAWAVENAKRQYPKPF